MSEVKEFFDALPTDGENPFEDEEKDTPADSSTETKPETEESPSQEGETEDTPSQKDEEPEQDSDVSEDNTPDEPVPFHEHPRFKEVIDEKNQLKETVQTYEQKLQEIEQRLQPQPAYTQVPDWFQRLYGDDPETYQLYMNHQEQERQVLAQQIRQSIYEEQQQQVQQRERWEKWVDSELAAMEADGLKFDRNRLIKVALDYQPSDENGNIDLRKAYKIMRLDEKPSEDTKVRKKVASISKTKKEPDNKNVVTAQDIRKKDWFDY